MQGALRVGKGKAPPLRSGTTEAPFRLTPVAEGLGSLTHVAAPPGDGERLMVAHRNGLVSLLKGGVLQSEPLLDLRDRVRSGYENGLHSIAFAPDYAQSGLFYVSYNDLSANLRVAEFRRSNESPDVADPVSRRRVLTIVKPTETHNGGMLQFGPTGNLYVSVGDGGADPPAIPVGAPAQILSSPLGSILRIDPRGGRPYAVPSSNPFVDAHDALPEIVAYGLRNPWRFWIDARTRTMIIADVGEKAREEINVLPLDRLGLNFGWPCLEGTVVTDFQADGCAGGMFTAPVFEYEYARPSRCSIIGGVTVRDARVPRLAGLYLWSDLCDGVIRAIHPGAPAPAEIPLKRRVPAPTSFGVDALGRVHVTTLDGRLYRLDPS
jgi:glucose/arabinose dehydrogenase